MERPAAFRARANLPCALHAPPSRSWRPACVCVCVWCERPRCRLRSRPRRRRTARAVGVRVVTCLGPRRFLPPPPALATNYCQEPRLLTARPLAP
jgi:hypothetical protein